MKKLVYALIAAAMILLSGCQTAGEVQHRIVVHAIGIDGHEKGYEVSYQVFSGGAPDGAPVDADESTVVTLLTQGRTLFECEESLRLQTGKEVFLGDAELIVVSEELKDEKLTEFLQYFRKSDVYLGVNVVYCKGKAKDTIGAKLEQGSATAILLRGVVEEAIRNGRAQSARIIEISNALERDNEAIAVPILSLEKDDGSGKSSGGEEKGSDSSGGGSGKDEGEKSKDEDSTVSDTTIGVFESQFVTPDGAGDILDEDAVMGIRLLRADVKTMAIQVEVPQGIASVEISNIKIKRKMALRDGIPELRVKINAIYDIRSFPIGSEDEEIRQAAQRELVALCQNGAQTLNDGDILQIGKMLWKYETRFAENLGGDFSDVIPKTSVSVEVKLEKY